MKKPQSVNVLRRIPHYSQGYEVRIEDVAMEGQPVEEMRSAYIIDTDVYIGTEEVARRLAAMNIRPEPVPGKGVAVVGYSEVENKWYGWSHRAIQGFGLGDVVEDDSMTTNAALGVTKGFTVRTLDDAKKVALAFADSVS